MAETTLKKLSDAMASAVETTSAGVVRVEARRRLPATGIVYADGVIVTAHHVIESDENIQIGLPGGETVSATLAGRDPNTDIAVLRTQAKLSVPQWASESDVLRVGHLVLALGRPTQHIQATLGVVSAITDENAEADVLIRVERRSEKRKEKEFPRMRRWDASRWWMSIGGRVQGAIQTDVTMYPGFSGGPLIDADGLVRGMNTSAVQGVSMTVPAAAVRRVVEMLLAHGKMRRGFLGVGAQPVRLNAGLSQSLGQEIGLLLVSVEAGSPAEKGGLFVGDTLVALDGHAVSHLEELLALLSGDRVGKAVSVQLVRGGELHERTVTIGERA